MYFFYNYGSLPQIQNRKRYRESHALFSATFKQKLELLRSMAGRDWKVPRGWRNQDRLSCWQPGKWGERRFAGTRLYRNCQVERKREKVNSWELNWKALQECERQNKENTQKIKTVRTLFHLLSAPYYPPLTHSRFCFSEDTACFSQSDCQG